MILFFASLLSTSISLAIFEIARVRTLLDQFLREAGIASYQVNRYRIDDDERLVVSQRAALRVTGRLLVLVAALAGLLAISVVPMLGVQFEDYSTRLLLLLSAAGIAPPLVVYGWLRSSPTAEEYPPAKQAFYYLTLGSPPVGKTLSRVERVFSRSLSQPPSTLFVTGLARAGTTALLQWLHRHPQMWSYTYRHMPFPMSSRLWLQLNRKRSQVTERSHRDGILVGLDSPEAFDEYFWRVILQESYYGSQGLRSHTLKEEQIAAFERLAASHLQPGYCYLSKNNNFLLRCQSYLNLRPETCVAFVYRDFAEHAVSLMRQHDLQSENQRRTPFVLDYMDMLGHHEFGLHRYDFVFPDTEFRYHDAGQLNYWVERWIDYYQTMLTVEGERIVVIANRDLRRQPERVSAALCRRVGLEVPSAAPSNLPAAAGQGSGITETDRSSAAHSIDPALRDEAETITKLLDARAERCFGK